MVDYLEEVAGVKKNIHITIKAIDLIDNNKGIILAFLNFIKKSLEKGKDESVPIIKNRKTFKIPNNEEKTLEETKEDEKTEEIKIKENYEQFLINQPNKENENKKNLLTKINKLKKLVSKTNIMEQSKNGIKQTEEIKEEKEEKKRRFTKAPLDYFKKEKFSQKSNDLKKFQEKENDESTENLEETETKNIKLIEEDIDEINEDKKVFNENEVLFLKGFMDDKINRIQRLRKNTILKSFVNGSNGSDDKSFEFFLI
jgi:hypothetical protein